MSANEIDKVSLASKNESLPVEQRITAVREWLRLSDYSARSCITARRIAKKILRDYKAHAASFEMSQKAERLLNFVEKGVQAKSRPAQEPTASAAPSTQATAATPRETPSFMTTNEYSGSPLDTKGSTKRKPLRSATRCTRSTVPIVPCGLVKTANWNVLTSARKCTRNSWQRSQPR